MGRYENTIVLNYRLTQKLGEGGFGTVFLAEHTELGRKAACKILHREYAEQTEVVERFFREAKAVCAIGHKAIIDIENFGRLPDGEPFYLMEFFPGESLMDRAKRQPLRVDEAVTVFDPVASALAAAHAKQIIHRDLKPENIMILEEDGAITDVKLLDFGIAKLVHEGDSVRSRTNVAMGTPAYMPPEQARDAKSVDQRGDVYSFAATVFASFAGRPPFVADSVAGVILKVQVDPVPSLVQLAPHVPASVQAAIEQCMDKDVTKRPPTIKEAWRTIRTALGAAPVMAASSNPGLAVTLAPDAPSMVVKGPALATTLGSAAAQDLTTPPSRRRWLLPVAGLVVLGGGVAIFAVTRGANHVALDAGPVAAADASSPDAASVVADVAIDPDPDAAVAIADAATAVLDAAKAVPTGPRTVPSSQVTATTSFPPVFSGPVPATITSRLCIDASGAVESVQPLTTLSASARITLIATLKRWRFAYKEHTAVCFSLSIKGASPVSNPGSGSAGSGSATVVQPSVDCSLATFQQLCDTPKPSDAEVSSAMKRLGQCRSKIAADKYANLIRCYTSKL